MGLFEILNPFQKEEIKSENTTSTTQSFVADVATQPNSQLGVQMSLPVQINPEIEKYFKDLMEQSNLPGPDYFEFKEALQSNLGLPEPMHYQSVYNTFKALKVTKEILINAIEVYSKIIKDGEVKFNETIETLWTKEVVQREQQKKKNEEEISKLQEKINQLSTENSNLNSEIIQHTAEISKNKNEYALCSQLFLNTFETDKQKINQYLT